MNKVKAGTMAARLAVASLVFLSGIAAGYFLRGGAFGRTENTVQHFEVRGNGTQFTNPLLECASPSDASENTMLRSFSSNVEELRRRLVNSGFVRDVSVYFRDLNNGPWFGALGGAGAACSTVPPRKAASFLTLG